MSRLWLRRDRNSPVEREALALFAKRVKLSAMKQLQRCRKYVLLHFRKQFLPMSLRRTIRLRRLIEPQYGSSIISVLDHCMIQLTLLDGLYDTRERTREAIYGG